MSGQKPEEGRKKHMKTQQGSQNRNMKKTGNGSAVSGKEMRPGDHETGLKKGMTPEEYKQYVKKITPVNNTWQDAGRAFLTGGTICLIGQMIRNWLTGSMDVGKEDAAVWTSVILVGSAVLLTGFNLYGKLVKWGGAGALVPITGFANSVASPAIEAQVEGQVFGIGCQIFKIAGPVILYGTFASWVLGVIYWMFRV